MKSPPWSFGHNFFVNGTAAHIQDVCSSFTITKQAFNINHISDTRCQQKGFVLQTIKQRKGLRFSQKQNAKQSSILGSSMKKNESHHYGDTYKIRVTFQFFQPYIIKQAIGCYQNHGNNKRDLEKNK